MADERTELGMRGCNHVGESCCPMRMMSTQATVMEIQSSRLIRQNEILGMFCKRLG